MAERDAGVPGPRQAIDFLTTIQSLKTTKRTGWVNNGVALPESIADHMYRMSLMAFLVQGKSDVDVGRCIRLAIVHDVAESLVGDITPHDGVSDADKHALEAAAIAKLQVILTGVGAPATAPTSSSSGPSSGTPETAPTSSSSGPSSGAPETAPTCSSSGPSSGASGSGPEVLSASALKALWDEYEAGTSPEARLVKDFDKLEMILQALEYENAQGKDLQSFFDGVRGKWKTDLGRQWAAEIERRREEARRT